jgi:hypothetical protein
MKSENYRTLLNNEYKNQELSADDFDSTLIYFAKLYHAEQSEQLVCNYCLEKTDALSDDFGCQTCIDNYK